MHGYLSKSGFGTPYAAMLAAEKVIEQVVEQADKLDELIASLVEEDQ